MHYLTTRGALEKQSNSLFSILLTKWLMFTFQQQS